MNGERSRHRSFVDRGESAAGAPLDISRTTAVVGPGPIAVDGSSFGWTAGALDTARILDSFVDAGGRLVLTADHWAGGRSEIMIGHWLRTGHRRSDLVVATKIGRHPDAPGLSARAIVSATEASLRRLAVDHLDILTLGGDHDTTPIDESLEAADALRRAGKVRHLAASGYRGARLAEIDELADSAVYPRFDTVVARYGLADREPFETDVAPVLATLGIGAIARLALDGILPAVAAAHSHRPLAPAGAYRLARRIARVRLALGRVAVEHGRPAGCVALAWASRHPAIATVAVRARTAAEIADVLTAEPVQLTRQQAALLDRAST